MSSQVHTWHLLTTKYSVIKSVIKSEKSGGKVTKAAQKVSHSILSNNKQLLIRSGYRQKVKLNKWYMECNGNEQYMATRRTAYALVNLATSLAVYIRRNTFADTPAGMYDYT